MKKCHGQNAIFSRLGSTMLFLAIIAVVLGIIGVSFNRQASDSRYITRRQGRSMFLRSFAQAVAHLALVKIQHQLNTDDNFWLKTTFLQVNQPELTDITRALQLDEFNEILTPMVQALQHEGEFSFSINVQAQKSDFSPTFYTSVFPAEKSGLLRLKVITSLKGFNEEFDFIAPVKVTSAMLPALSKFNFYLHNAAPDGDDFYFNQVTNNFRGEVNGPAKPMLFNNGNIPPQDLTWENLNNQAVGLIYLGGGEVRLNIAAATGSGDYDYSESFHFYKRSKPLPQSPFYLLEDRRNPPLTHPVLGDFPTMLLRYDLGISESSSADPLRNICRQVFVNAQYQYPDGDKEYMRSSILRLYGSDRSISPTLVLGKVYRGFLSISAAKVFSQTHTLSQMLIYPKNLADFNSMVSNTHGDRGVGGMLFPPPRNDSDLENFRDYYASGISYQPYNQSMAFISTRNESAGPLTEIEPASPELVRSMSPNEQGEITNPESLELPETLALMSMGKTLVELPELFSEAAFQPDSARESRFAYIIDMSNSNESSDLISELRRSGLMSANKLELNGWVFIKNPPAELIIENPLTMATNGGLVMAGPCNLLIKGNIEADRPDGKKFLLQIVALGGDIVIDTPRVDAALSAPTGKIVFRRNALVNGAMMMQRFEPGSSFPGATLNYNQLLAVKPGRSQFKESLAFAVQTIPMLVNQ